MKTEAVAVIRMSTTQQEDSPAIQRENIIRKFGAEYEIVKWYEDLGKSGSRDKHKRTDYLQMLKDAKTATWKVILCNNGARFTRENTLDAAADKKLLRDLGIRVRTVQDGDIDWTTSTGRIVDAVKAEADHGFSLSISKNTLDGKIKKAKDGKTYGQLTPYGLARQITDSLGNVLIVGRTERYRKPKESIAVYIPGDEDEQLVVRNLFKEFAAKDKSFHQLAKELNEKKIPSPSGGTWVYQVVHEILKNPRYVGDLSLGENAAGAFHRIENGVAVPLTRPEKMKTGRKPSILVQNTHEGIVDRETFDAVQRKLARRKKTGQHSQRSEGFALTGVLICGQCGKPMYGNERTDPKRHRVGVKYSCKGWHRNFGSGCGQWGVHQDDVLFILCETLKQQIDSQILAKAEAQWPPKMMDQVHPKLKKLEKAKASYEASIRKFLLLPPDSPHNSALEADLTKQKEEIAALEAEVMAPGETQEQWLQRCHQFWQGIKDKLIWVPDTHYQPGQGQPFKSGSASFGRLVKDRAITPSTIRELLHSIGCKLTLWFEHGKRRDGSEARSYEVVKAHLKTDNVATHFDISPSPGLSKCVDYWFEQKDLKTLAGKGQVA